MRQGQPRAARVRDERRRSDRGLHGRPAQLDREWDEFEDFVARLTMPFFYVPGNHDMSNRGDGRDVARALRPVLLPLPLQGRALRRAELRAVRHGARPAHPLPGPWQQAEQLACVERTLRREPRRALDVRVRPPAALGLAAAEPGLAEGRGAAGSRPHTVFAGHFHRYTEHVRNDRQYITLATTGGGSRLRGTPFGEFDQVAQVSMTSRAR